MFFLPGLVLVLLRVFPKAKGIGQLRFISTSDDPLDFCRAALHMVFMCLVTSFLPKGGGNEQFGFCCTGPKIYLGGHLLFKIQMSQRSCLLSRVLVAAGNIGSASGLHLNGSGSLACWSSVYFVGVLPSVSMSTIYKTKTHCINCKIFMPKGLRVGHVRTRQLI